VDYSNVDRIALALPYTISTQPLLMAQYFKRNFKGEVERSPAIFAWITSRIVYDPNFDMVARQNEAHGMKVAYVLKERSGVCENYAQLFDTLARLSGLRSYVLRGYTMIDGRIDPLPHAWNAIEIDGAFYHMDATWAAGYVQQGRFIRKQADQYFMAPPAHIIRSHMPFDPMFQLLEHPQSHSDFERHLIASSGKGEIFDFRDSLDLHDSRIYLDQIKARSKRMAHHGVVFKMSKDRWEALEQEILVLEHNQNTTFFNEATEEFNEGVNGFNAYVNYLNQGFLPARSDKEIQDMLSSTWSHFHRYQEEIEHVQTTDESMLGLMRDIQRQEEEVLSQLADYQNWLNEYLEKGTMGRKLMFSTGY